MKKNILFSLLLLFLVGCEKEFKVQNVERAFYYWKSKNWQFESNLETILQRTETKKLYIKFFEVENNDLMGNIPVAKNDMNFYDKSIKVIPTIFINNDVFLKSTKKELDLLADNINFLINRYLRNNFPDNFSVNEFQMDCDWTIKSKDHYFYFLEKIKSLSKMDLSCTLRLYPYKYREQMGIPPVDKVTLMCYNLLNPLENATQNSILDVEELAKYLNVTEKYPLHIDIALPIYSWMQLYQNNQFQNVIYNSHDYLLKNMKKTDSLWYEVTEDVSVGDNYIRIGDKIKYEKVTHETLEKTIALLKKKIQFDANTTITLFHLDDAQLQKYSDDEINNLFTAFSK